MKGNKLLDNSPDKALYNDARIGKIRRISKQALWNRRHENVKRFVLIAVILKIILVVKKTKVIGKCNYVARYRQFSNQ